MQIYGNADTFSIVNFKIPFTINEVYISQIKNREGIRSQSSYSAQRTLHLRWVTGSVEAY